MELFRLILVCGICIGKNFSYVGSRLGLKFLALCRCISGILPLRRSLLIFGSGVLSEELSKIIISFKQENNPTNLMIKFQWELRKMAKEPIIILIT